MIKNSYLGFTDNMKPMQKARVEKTLDALIRFNGKVITQKEWIIMKLQEGFTPYVEKDYSYYSNKTREMTKPKDDYRLQSEKFYNSITKTEYDFAQYILENDLTDEQKINEYVTVEQERIAEENRIKAEKEAKERAEREEQERIEKEKRNAERQAKIAKWTEIGNSLLTEEVRQIIKESIAKHWDKFHNPKESLEEATERYINNTPQYLGNVEFMKGFVSRLVFEEINKYNTQNIIEREAYMRIFNIQEGDSKHTVTAKVKAFIEGRQYKGGNNTPESTETFFVRNSDGSVTEKEGVKIVIKGFILYGVSENDQYVLTEKESGMTFAKGRNKTEAIQKAKEVIKRNGVEKVKELIAYHVNKNGSLLTVAV